MSAADALRRWVGHLTPASLSRGFLVYGALRPGEARELHADLTAAGFCGAGKRVKHADGGVYFERYVGGRKP